MGIHLIHNLRLQRLDLHDLHLGHVFCSFYVCSYFLETPVILKPVIRGKELLKLIPLVTLFLQTYALLFRNLCDEVVLT